MKKNGDLGEQMRPRWDVADLFLELLDPTATKFTLQTFTDKKAHERKGGDPLARVLYGSLDRLSDELAELQRKGAGVFVTINATKGKRRRLENLVRVRAVWADLDHGLPDRDWPLEPSLVVKSSPGRYQVYWLVSDEMAVHILRGILARLVRDWGGDPRATDPVRVLRLPGFYHQKREPYRVRLLDAESLQENGCQQYRTERLIKAFPPLERAKKLTLPAGFNFGTTDPELVREALGWIADKETDSGETFVNDYEKWIKIGMALRTEFGDAGLTLWDEWSKASDKYDEEDIAYKWSTFRDDRRDGDVTLGSVFQWAEDAEWKRPGRKDSARQSEGATLEAEEDDTDQTTSDETGTPGERVARIECLASVIPKPMLWLWPDVIARGALNVAVGDPGQGKSQLSCDIAARTTTGTPWPGTGLNTQQRKPSSVIILNAEDALDSVVVPRLKAAGADLNRVFRIKSVTRFDKDGKARDASFSLQEDIATLEKALKQHPEVSLIIIDPISAYLGKVDSHNNSEVRGVLEPLSRLAERYKVAILCISHLNKGSDNTKALYRVTGSLAFAAAARSVYAVAPHPEDRDKDNPRRVFMPIKTNLAKPASTRTFEIEQHDVVDGTPVPIPTSRIKWGGKLDGFSAEDVLSPKPKRRSDLERAKEWLLECLADGSKKSAETIFAQAREEGHERHTVKRASAEIQVVKSKDGYGGNWLWTLPSPPTCH